mgnify:FL=1
MTNSQKLGIICVLSIAGWALWAVGRYWVANTLYANGQKNYQFFVKTQDPQYLITSFNNFQSASKMNPREPAILSETTVSAAYIATALAQSNATSAGQLAQLSVSLSQLSISLSPHHPNYYKSAARAYILLSDFPAAAQVLSDAEKISPTDPRLPYNLGIIYKYLNATDSARLQFQKSLRLKPDFPDPAQQLLELDK